MSIPTSAEGIGNVLRLQGLKNVSGRRRVRGQVPELEELNAIDTDVSGAGADLNPVNMPNVETGAELTPQSYDVRANEVIAPSPGEEASDEGDSENILTRFGRALAMNLGNHAAPMPAQSQAEQAPPIATQQVEMAEGLPPVNPEMEGQEPPTAESPGFWGSIGNALKEYVQPFVSSEAREKTSAENRALLEDAQMRAKGLNPEVERPRIAQEQQAAQQVSQEAIDKAQENPMETVVYGATDRFANSPELKRELQTYTGIDFTPQVEEMTKKYEKVLSDLENNLNAEGQGYDEQAQRLKERILSNSATDMDKYYIGLALLMPLIIGGFFGKEVGLGALGGSAEGLAKAYGQRFDRIRKDEDALSDLNKQRANVDAKRGELELQKLKVPGEIQKLLPADEYEDIKGMDIAKFTDPETGEIVASGPEVLPDLVADLKYFNTAKKRDKMQETAAKIEEEKAALQRANDATRDVINAVVQIKDPGLMGKILAIGMTEGVDAGGISLGPNAIKKAYKNGLFGDVPQIKDENGRMVNAAVYLDAKIEQIKDAYRRNEQMRAFTNTVAQHVGSMAENPLYSGLKPEDLVTQMLILRDRGQQFFVDRAKAQGFLPIPLENALGKQNRELYKGLNRKEGEKTASQLLRE